MGATDGYDLYATNGSAVIYQLRPGDTSELTLMRTILVQSRGRTFPLGALVYAHPVLWVSVWQTKRLIRVNLDGEIEAWLEMDDAHSFGDIRDAPSAIAQSAFVGPDVLLVTGRSWPSVLSLTLSAGALCGRETCEAPASPSPTPVTMPPTLPRTHHQRHQERGQRLRQRRWTILLTTKLPTTWWLCSFYVYWSVWCAL